MIPNARVPPTLHSESVPVGVTAPAAHFASGPSRRPCSKYIRRSPRASRRPLPLVRPAPLTGGTVPRQPSQRPHGTPSPRMRTSASARPRYATAPESEPEAETGGCLRRRFAALFVALSGDRRHGIAFYAVTGSTRFCVSRLNCSACGSHKSFSVPAGPPIGKHQRLDACRLAPPVHASAGLSSRMAVNAFPSSPEVLPGKELRSASRQPARCVVGCRSRHLATRCVLCPKGGAPAGTSAGTTLSIAAASVRRSERVFAVKDDADGDNKPDADNQAELRVVGHVRLSRWSQLPRNGRSRGHFHPLYSPPRRRAVSCRRIAENRRERIETDRRRHGSGRADGAFPPRGTYGSSGRGCPSASTPGTQKPRSE